MRAGLRFTTILLAGGLWLAPATALAQNTTEPAGGTPANTPATNAIGPRELQNFSLPGTTTRPADQPATTTPTSPPRMTSSNTAGTRPAPALARRTPALRQPASTTPAPRPSTQSANSPTALPPATGDVSAAAPQPAVSSAVENLPTPNGTLASERKLSILPWLAAALALAGGTIFLLWRRRPREAYAGGAEFDLFVAPEPAPAPPAPRSPQPRASAPPPPELPPVPEPPRAEPRATAGIVASRLRPALEIGVQPLRCLVADDNVTIEFEIDLFNSGAAPARAILAEASLFNPGATQEQELATFFANPVGAGNRLDAIQPMKRVTLTSQVVAPRAAIQEYELAGRKSFVPVIAFNALYEWSGGKGQTSAAYLVGRDTGSEKLGPLRLDPGPREVRGLGARALPSAVRT